MPSSEWTVEDHLRDEPAPVVALYQRFVELVQACGPFEYAVSKTAIGFKGSRRGFAGAKPEPTAWMGIWICSGGWRTRGSVVPRPTLGAHQAPGGAPAPHQRARAAG
jgi:hypothetical protein